MSQLVSRILLAICVFPLGAMVYVVTVFCTHDYGSYRQSGWAIAGGVTWAFVATYWYCLWRKSVRWTSERRAGTIGLAVGAVLVGGFAGGFLSSVDTDFGWFVGSATAPLLWLVGTVFVWRETAAERGARLQRSGGDAVVCPTCGYNLTGLSEPRCPECGTRFTLDQLLAGQPGRANADLES